MVCLYGGLALLVGCNGGSDSGDQSSNLEGGLTVTSPSPQIYAEDIFVELLQDYEVSIPIEQRVFRSDGGSVEIHDVKVVGSDSLHCNDVSFTDDEIQFNTRVSGVCVYEYSVNASMSSLSRSSTYSDTIDTKASAHAYIVVQPEGAAVTSSNLLPILSVVAGTSELVIDIEDDLGSDFPSGAELNEAVTVLGTGVARVDTTDNTITFFGGNTGVTRLIYSLSASDGAVSLGVIDITTSTQTANVHPVFTDFEYSGTMSINLEKSELTGTIDVAPYVSDPDSGQSLQIIGYRGFNITLSSAASDPSSPTKFDFKVNLAGVYYVSVTITDHHGGYTTGFVKINVNNMFSPISVDKTLFLPPISFVEAQYSGFAYTGSYKETKATGPEGFVMALVTYDIADAICKSKGGRLPSVQEMDAFVEQETSNKLWGDTNKQWPIGKAYFTQSVSGDNTHMYIFNTFSIPALGIQTSVQNALGYVSCVDMTPVSLSIDNERVYINVTSTLTASFETSLGLKYPYNKPLTWSMIAGDAYVTLIGDQAEGDSEGVATIKTVNHTNKLITTKDISIIDKPELIMDVVNGSVNEGIAFTSTTPSLSGGFGTIIWSVSGDDSKNVDINSSTGVVSMAAMDYENPLDSDKNNAYDITAKATDIDGNSQSKVMVITVINQYKSGLIGTSNNGLGPCPSEIEYSKTVQCSVEILAAELSNGGIDLHMNTILDGVYEGGALLAGGTNGNFVSAHINLTKLNKIQGYVRRSGFDAVEFQLNLQKIIWEYKDDATSYEIVGNDGSVGMNTSGKTISNIDTVEKIRFHVQQYAGNRYIRAIELYYE
ncbi:cadherin repeat domain-containing protein [Vibrio sp. DW001]|uniref:cadherin repeat domain-containing protein n=1 Tax=Vibrio sp. DW001 TaxID=2912315 RepID=UPI0023B04394|nr:cadherin repeat domain-containing protein [Vibrio sp. DW001]WED27658.1 cadherin repeat domain-containing protein [Vibrio sp. DW001]